MEDFFDFIVYLLNCQKYRGQRDVDMKFGSNSKQRSEHEILFGTRFINTFNTIFSTIVENVKTQCIRLAPSLTTINQTKIPYTSPSFQKTNCTLQWRGLQRNPFFAFLLIFTANELCNISNKYRPPSNLPSNNIFTQETLYIYFEKILALFIANVF